MKRPASLVAAILFWLIALAQLLRVLLRVRVTAGSHDIPLWLSAVAFVVLGALGLWLWRERREHDEELKHSGKHGAPTTPWEKPTPLLRRRHCPQVCTRPT